MIHHISAMTFPVRSMPEAITSYAKLDFTLIYGGSQARFSTLQAGNAFVNLTLLPGYLPTWWGRTIFRVHTATVRLTIRSINFHRTERRGKRDNPFQILSDCHVCAPDSLGGRHRHQFRGIFPPVDRAGP